ncbi:MAG: Methicillin resistance protein [Candidatus Magasanikbacteria bacterium GW2011_GWC2_37_14]|uniref:Methicillin resistance protein n=1 Tax=Candidatus Magasanikbacteria bacterium GW2011_GWC2_37_14 TaxID=1619046 RepID=A0A0G0G997_9BACT|nr:MAG: Methicillin resistance protein [Candidatus Magasanikbacteria bacterium GW2011_GWC2_37_14]
MEIKICENKNEWEKQQKEHNNTSASLAQAEFLQSWDWGEFQKLTGKNVQRWQIVENGQVVGQIQGFEHKLPGLGNYFYIPRLKVYDLGFKDLVNFLKNKNYIFIRIEPVEKFSYALYLSSYVRNRQPAQTLILDLKQTELEILGAMHSKTRYNIHLAEKHGVIAAQEKNAEIFWQLNLQTTGRDKFKSHEFEYYQKMLAMPNCYQLTAYFNNKPIASNILIVANKTITYLHGASSNEQRNLMAPYLLQWEGLKLGKSLDCENYDFWGVAPFFEIDKHPDFFVAELVDSHSNSPHFKNQDTYQSFGKYFWHKKHAWSGVTKFKVGFGGNYREYPQACDIIFKPFFYKLYKFAKKLF